MLFSTIVPLVFFTLATCVASAPTPGPGLKPVRDDSFLTANGGHWTQLPSRNNLQAAELYFEKGTGSNHLEVDIVKNLNHVVREFHPLDTLNNENDRRRLIGQWQQGLKLIKIVFEDNQFKWAPLTEREAEGVNDRWQAGYHSTAGTKRPASESLDGSAGTGKRLNN